MSINPDIPSASSQTLKVDPSKSILGVGPTALLPPKNPNTKNEAPKPPSANLMIPSPALFLSSTNHKLFKSDLVSDTAQISVPPVSVTTQKIVGSVHLLIKPTNDPSDAEIILLPDADRKGKRKMKRSSLDATPIHDDSPKSKRGRPHGSNKKGDGGFYLHHICVIVFLDLCSSNYSQAGKSLPLGTSLSKLRLMDQLRHQQIGVLNLTLLGSLDINSYGFYFTKVKIGTPAQEFSLIVDTGCNLSWLSCIPCDRCQTSNKFGMQLRFYDPQSSSSSSPVLCSDKICYASVDPTISIGTNCSLDMKCGYIIRYADGSGTSGHLISDVFDFSPTVSGSAMFGCNNLMTGRLAESGTVVDGLLGLGHGLLSVISHLSSEGVVPPMFAHCLGGEDGGGILVVGEIGDPNLVYTPIVSSGLYYNLNLQSIAVDGKIVDIDPGVFALEDGKGGTIVDSGTALSILAEKAFDPFIHSD